MKDQLKVDHHQICGSKEKNKRKAIYSFLDSYHGSPAELEACKQLLKYAMDENDKDTV